MVKLRRAFGRMILRRWYFVPRWFEIYSEIHPGSSNAIRDGAKFTVKWHRQCEFWETNSKSLPPISKFNKISLPGMCLHIAAKHQVKKIDPYHFLWAQPEFFQYTLASREKTGEVRLLEQLWKIDPQLLINILEFCCKNSQLSPKSNPSAPY